jgi:hypothetical protein
MANGAMGRVMLDTGEDLRRIVDGKDARSFETLLAGIGHKIAPAPMP